MLYSVQACVSCSLVPSLHDPPAASYPCSLLEHARAHMLVRHRPCTLQRVVMHCSIARCRTRLCPRRRCGVLAVKAGMTHEWDQWGARVPLTVLWIDDCQVRSRTCCHAGLCCTAAHIPCPTAMQHTWSRRGSSTSMHAAAHRGQIRIWTAEAACGCACTMHARTRCCKSIIGRLNSGKRGSGCRASARAVCGRG